MFEKLRAQAWTLPLARLAFFAVGLFVFVAAVIPKEDHPPDLFGWDKANHFAAFYALSLLGAGAFPRRSPVVLGAWLSGLGALIEVVQALPFIHRDADVMDWLTDTFGVMAALCPLLLAHWRSGYRRPPA